MWEPKKKSEAGESLWVLDVFKMLIILKDLEMAQPVEGLCHQPEDLGSSLGPT